MAIRGKCFDYTPLITHIFRQFGKYRQNVILCRESGGEGVKL
ncbi:hypothetical protein NMH_0146 [Neisseria meningitidis H44/76]|uniref:Uncharacterized protein n=1 Tax=Neisseria meningitidis serogroup B / serotype 15 (strain H44/76) TaxID=909420 RepID=E6MVE0_NEIMH|nr:hypothetical protein NMH_0146 [Neisseria meningitidis H44/76]